MTPERRKELDATLQSSGGRTGRGEGMTDRVSEIMESRMECECLLDQATEMEEENGRLKEALAVAERRVKKALHFIESRECEGGGGGLCPSCLLQLEEILEAEIAAEEVEG